jgi:hypothetical protein
VSSGTGVTDAGYRGCASESLPADFGGRSLRRATAPHRMYTRREGLCTRSCTPGSSPR